MRGEDAAPVVDGGPEDRDAGAVPEQHGGVAATGGLVEPPGMHLGADEEHRPVLPGADPRVGDRQPIEEPAALVADVHGGDVAQAELALQEDAVAGFEVVGSAGAVDDAVEVGGLEAGFGEGFERRGLRQPDAGLAGTDPVAGLDPRPLQDPLVRRLHHAGEVLVGDEARRHVEAGREEFGTGHRVAAVREGEKISPTPRESKGADGSRRDPRPVRCRPRREAPARRAQAGAREGCGERRRVHADAQGDVTPDTKVYDELVRAIMTHPEF